MQQPASYSSRNFQAISIDIIQPLETKCILCKYLPEDSLKYEYFDLKQLDQGIVKHT